MKSILLPVDFTEVSKIALDYALALARPFSSHITLFHCFEINVYPADASVPPLDHIQELIEEKEKAVKQQLDDWISEIEGIHVPSQEHEAQRVTISGKYEQGIPLERIAAEASNGAYDFLIMGTNGSHGMEEYLWGSTTSHLAHKVKIPLMAIPKEAAFKGIKHVVYATNFTVSDFMVIDQLQHLCSVYESKLTCVHINKDLERLPEEEKQLASLEQKFWFSPVQELSFRLITDSSVEAGLSQFIAEQEVDALAVHTGKHSFFESLFHRSLSKKLLNHTHVPLIIYH